MTTEVDVLVQLYTDRRREPEGEYLRELTGKFADLACDLTDAVAPWTPATVEEVLAGIDIAAEALERLGPSVVEPLATVTAGTAALRRLVQGVPPSATRSARRTRPRRRGLGPGWQGVQQPAP
ncbi:hypothetical protein ACFWEV_34860 [Streptomyces bacillaris]|uniref:hypothetical protein n=1 Tax=Streptomyces bacillaris TaxID=68179 RepID=UPI003658B564